MDSTEIKKMSTTERLKIMEAIWDSLLHDETNIESPQWHKNVLAERKSKIENGEAEFVSIKKLKTKHRS